jgi:hypothetical protein
VLLAPLLALLLLLLLVVVARLLLLLLPAVALAAGQHCGSRQRLGSGW